MRITDTVRFHGEEEGFAASTKVAPCPGRCTYMRQVRRTEDTRVKLPGLRTNGFNPDTASKLLVREQAQRLRPKIPFK
jgi:hypothetical protein